MDRTPEEKWQITGDGMAALRDYWGKVLAIQPNLNSEFVEVRGGFECLTILYRNHRGQQGAETVEFGKDGSVVRSFACYG